MSNENNNSQGGKKNKKIIPQPPNKPNFQIWTIVLLIVFIVSVVLFSSGNNAKEISQHRFEEIYKDGDVNRVVMVNKSIIEVYLKESALTKEKYQNLSNESAFSFSEGPHLKFRIADPASFDKKFEELEENLSRDERIGYEVVQRQDFSSFIFQWGFLILILFGFWFLMRRMTTGGAGGQIFNIGKSRAALFDPESKVKITFKDVAGLDEAKEEVQEIVEFLKTPSKFTKLGGKIPKGALLVGPPGTGKTLLAKAVAGEAGVPFFSLSGSDFVEMFVGVGAARVRDLFKQAKEKAPCIVFIDEIDAIGRSRGKGQMPGSNDERENTLNSLLVEMDGFTTDSGVIIIAATNRPDVLDSALLRPGRFDRQISIDKPDLVGREAIFRVHLKPLKLSDEVDTKKLSAQTPGFAGAEIANVCNEAALIAARNDKNHVDMQDFYDAIDRVIGGLEKKNKIISPEEKKIVAYHEAGHAVAGWFLEHADPLVKVSIVPRGVAALGYAQYLPKEQFLYQTEQLVDEMCMALGGRAAEEIIFNKISTGALSDLERITKMAYSIVKMYGMNERLGNISFYDSKGQEYSFDKPYSEATAETIDEEVRKLIDSTYKRTKDLLIEKKVALEKVAEALLEKEIIFQSDLEKLIGKRPFQKPTNYEAFTKKVEEQKEKESTGEEKKEEEAKEEKGNKDEGKDSNPSDLVSESETKKTHLSGNGKKSDDESDSKNDDASSKEEEKTNS